MKKNSPHFLPAVGSQVQSPHISRMLNLSFLLCCLQKYEADSFLLLWEEKDLRKAEVFLPRSTWILLPLPNLLRKEPRLTQKQPPIPRHLSLALQSDLLPFRKLKIRLLVPPESPLQRVFPEIH